MGIKKNSISYIINVKNLITSVTVAAGFFHLYTGGFGILSSMNQRAIHWMLMSFLVFLVYPARKKDKGKLKWYDVVFSLLTLLSSLYIIFRWQDKVLRIGASSQLEVIFDYMVGLIIIIVIFEAARRTTGLMLSVTALIFFIYTFVGPYLPGVFFHRGYSLSRVTPYMIFTTEGVYGVAIGVSSTFIVLFVLFGSFLNETGGGKFFIDLAFSIAGRLKGGTAKTAVISSGLMGSISGSPIANVVTTGTFTVPLMIHSGYKPHVACAVEAVSSTGGMLMPPMMGAAAFIMAEFLSIPYRDVVIAAFLPALLYYTAIYFIVHLEASKNGLTGLPKNQLPNFWTTILDKGYLLIPLLGLIIFLVMGRSAMRTVFWSMISLMVISVIKPETRLNLKKFIKALENGIRNMIPVATACAAAGIIVGAVNLTGLGVRFSNAILSISGNFPFLALVMTMFAALVLGMGLPATAVYVVVASVTAPALIKMGFLPIAAHLFVFYFGIISTITPPVALTSYAAAGLIENVNPHKVGIKAFIFGLIAFIIPFIFIYDKNFLLQGAVFSILYKMLFAITGLYFISAGIVGYFRKNENIILRLILFSSGLAMLIPDWYMNSIGIVMISVLVFIKYKYGSKLKNN